jgi:sugar lactone lactonase YvrE
MVNPQQMAFGPNGDLFVADEVNVVEFRGTTGVFVADFVVGGTHGLSGPDGLVFGPGGKLYVAGAGSHNVNQYDANTGAFLSTFISSGLSRPDWLSFGPDGNLYVSDQDANDVVRFNGTNGSFINTFVTPGSGGLISGGNTLFPPVPEPSSLFLCGIAAVGLGICRQLARTRQS